MKNGKTIKLCVSNKSISIFSTVVVVVVFTILELNYWYYDPNLKMQAHLHASEEKKIEAFLVMRCLWWLGWVVNQTSRNLLRIATSEASYPKKFLDVNMAPSKPDGTSFTFYTEKFLSDGTHGIVLHRG